MGVENDGAAAAPSGKDPRAPDSRISTSNGKRYWEGVDADVNGMLGGFPAVSMVDLRGSRAFLAKLGIGRPGRGLRKARRAMEGGAGIGRITRGLLVDVADDVDVVEPIGRFTKTLDGVPGVARIQNVGLEAWQPEGTGDVVYDLIWNQWCLGHLNDRHLVEYLRRCASVLAKDEETGKVTGFIVVKENNTTTGLDYFDELDSAVTRSDAKFRQLFQEAGLCLVRTELQRALPKELYPVRSYALRPQ